MLISWQMQYLIENIFRNIVIYLGRIHAINGGLVDIQLEIGYDDGDENRGDD